MSRLIVVFILIYFLSAKIYATGQAGDRIIIGNDTLQLLSAPFEPILQQRNITANDLWGDSFDYNTACWRAYIATWKIENEKLYLIELAPCNYYDYPKGKCPKVNLGKKFPDICEEGKIFAGWVNEELLIANGELLHSESNGFDRIYAKEIGLFFMNGLIVKRVNYDNSKTKVSQYSQNEILLRDFIQSNIDWKGIESALDSTTRKVYCSIISVKENGKIDSVSIIYPANVELLNREAERVIKTIPQWDVLYKRGKLFPRIWTLPVRFDMAMMKKYSN